MAVKKEKVFEKEKGKSGGSDVMQRTQELAYAYYLDRLRTNQPGDAVSDWVAAESQILGKRGS